MHDTVQTVKFHSLMTGYYGEGLLREGRCAVAFWFSSFQKDRSCPGSGPENTAESQPRSGSLNIWVPDLVSQLAL